MANYARWCLLRRIHSRRQVLEIMTEFWEDHLHVPSTTTASSPTAPTTARSIRSHALGRFDDMLVAAITHPAMGISLDNASSTKTAPQREPRPRAARAAHPRPRATTPRTTSRPPPASSPATASTCGAPGRRRTTPPATGPARSRCWASPTPTPTPTAARSPRPTCAYLAHHPAHRAPDRPQARGPLRLRHPLGRRWSPHLAQVYLDHGTAIRPVLGPWSTTPSSGPRPAPRSARPPTTSSPPTACSAPASPGPPTTSRRPTRCCGRPPRSGTAPFEWARPDGPPQDNRSWSSAVAAAGLVRDALRDGGRLVAQAAT